MTQSISNDTGRAFEYKLIDEFVNHCNKILVKLTDRAKSNQIRDKHYFETLSERLQENLTKGAKAFIKWTDKEKWCENTQEILIDRMPDSAGIQGDVTDIKFHIKKDKQIIEKNISVKHHHNALKHPRLPRLPEQCGINDIEIKEEYIRKHNIIWNNFKEKAIKLNPDAIKFNELKHIDPTFIDNHLYRPLIELVISFMNEHLTREENLKCFFQFLTGITNFITIKNEDSCILIKHFETIKIPKKFKIKYPAGASLTTFVMELDNRWKITFRLHTASEYFIKNGRLHTSVKFDVLCINLDEVIEIERISKD